MVKNFCMYLYFKNGEGERSGFFRTGELYRNLQ